MSEEVTILPVTEPEVTEEPTCPVPLIGTFTDYYSQILESTLADDSIISRNMAAIIEQFDIYGLTNEEKAKYIAEMYVNTTNEGAKTSANAALQVMKQEAETPLKCAQVELVERQTQGYDESMLIKIMEQQGNLASFSVNADSDYAQDTINDLKCQMSQIQSRSVALPDETVCVISGAPTPIPGNLRSTTVTDTTIRMVWNAVAGSSSYQLYMDGIEVSSGGDLFFDAPALTQLTKYSFNVRATKGGNASGLSSTVTVVTTATPIP